MNVAEVTAWHVAVTLVNGEVWEATVIAPTVGEAANALVTRIGDSDEPASIIAEQTETEVLVVTEDEPEPGDAVGFRA
jgi:hypothetical protein